VASKSHQNPALDTRSVLAQMAPGTALRDGLQRILRGSTGALIVLGLDKTVSQISSGGFKVDIEFTATRLRELAKMDGAVICDAEATRIHEAAVQLLPDPSIPTEEQGTRHRTADRVSRQTGLPVISVSKSMNIIALYLDGHRHVLEDSAAILSRANQALATLERYRLRLDEVTNSLSALEIEDMVTVRDVAVVAQRYEMVRRIASEISGYLVELGNDGRLVALQLEEFVAGTEIGQQLAIRDYLPGTGKRIKPLEPVLAALSELDSAGLLDLGSVAAAIGLPNDVESMDGSVHPRGYRILNRIPRLPEIVIENLVSHFGGLQKILSAGVEDLRDVEGVGETRARHIRENLARLAEASLMERFA
jgi:diadenylate cyclase